MIIIANGEMVIRGPFNEVVNSTMQRDIYKVAARIEMCSRAQKFILVDGLA